MDINNKSGGKICWKIYSMNGHIQQQGSCYKATDSLADTLDPGNLRQGLFLVQVQFRKAGRAGKIKKK